MKARKTLSLVLALVMVALLIPFGAAAADENVAEIGEKGYTDLTTALVEAAEGETVTVLKDCTINFSTLGALNKSITVEAKAGLTEKPAITCSGAVTASCQFVVAEGKTLTLKGLSFTSGNNLIGVLNNATYNLIDVDMAVSGWYCIYVKSANGGTVNIDGGNYTSNYSVVYIDSLVGTGDVDFDLNIDGGAYLKQTANGSGTYTTIFNGNARPNVNITISGKDTYLSLHNANPVIKNTGANCSITINNGLIEDHGGYCIVNTGNATQITVNGGELKGTGGAWTLQNGGTASALTVNGGTISSDTSHAVIAKDGSNINVTGGTITSGNATQALKTEGNVTVSIAGGTIAGKTYTLPFGNQYVQYKQAADTTDLRLVTDVTVPDTAAYTEMGFMVSLSAKEIFACTEKVVKTSETKLYTSVLAGGEVIKAPAENVYWLAVELSNIPASDYDSTIYVRAYAKTADGVYVFGEMQSMTVNGVTNPQA